MLISRSDIKNADILPYFAPHWREGLRESKVTKTPSGLPVLIEGNRTLVDVSTVARHATVERSSDDIRQLMSRIRSNSYGISDRHAQALLEGLPRTGPLVGVVVGGGTIGPGVSRFIENDRVRLFSFDVYDSEHLTFIADGHENPLADGIADFVWIQAVLEHVADPRTVAEECQRILRPGGIIYAETPFMQQIHEGRYDFTRFTTLGHRMLFPNCDAMSMGALDGPGVALTWALRYFFSGLFRTRNAGRFAALIFSWLKFFDYLIPEAHRQMGASASYFMGKRRSAEAGQLLPRDMLREYGGV
jgi:SAM-dependent methyltransferase